MAGGDAAVQGRRPLQFSREMERASRAFLCVADPTKSVPPPPLTRRFAALTATPPPAPDGLSSMRRTDRMMEAYHGHD